MIDVTIDRPTILTVLQQLRRDPRTAALRVALTARSGYFDEAERIARTDPRTKAFSRPCDAKACRQEIEQLETLGAAEFVAGRGPAGPGRPRRWSCWPIWNNRRRDSTISAAPNSRPLPPINNPKLAAKAVRCWPAAGAPAAQRALVELASRPLQPMPLRQAAYQSFRQNTRKFGVLLAATRFSASTAATTRA